MSNLVGKTLLDRYHVQEFLGRGGMAEVYKVWDQKRSVHLAMKVLEKDLATDRVFMRRFKREAENLSKLQHPSIVRFYGLEQVDLTAFILMDFVEGDNLKTLIYQNENGIDEDRMRSLMRAVLGGIQFAHNMGIVHCDIKPANIMLNRHGEALLSDFGISRLTDAATATMVGIGTPAYMAPEQIRGQDPTPQTDIYALGIVLFEMMTGGERPFTGEAETTTGSNSERVRWEQINLQPPSPREFNPEVSKEMEAVIFCCLEKDPSNRYQSSLDLLNALEAALGEGEAVEEEEEGTVIEQVEEATTELLDDEEVTVIEQGEEEEVTIIRQIEKPTPVQFVEEARVEEKESELRNEPAETGKKKMGWLIGMGVVIVGFVGMMLLGSGRGGELGIMFPETTKPKNTPRPTSTPRPTNTPRPTPFGGGGGKIVFESSRDGDNDIYIMDADGSSVKNLTNNNYGDHSPAWSPDGRKIIFHVYRDAGRNIYVMDADGSDLTLLINIDNYDSSPSWSNVGNKVAFESYLSGNREIYVFDIDGNNLSRITDNEAGNNSPSWSPDGNWIAFSTDRDWKVNIYVVDSDGNFQNLLTDNEGNDFSPAWSPYGDKIAFVSDRDGNDEIYVMDADGNNIVRLTNIDASDSSPAWSPDGSKLVFVSDRDGNDEIYVMNVDGSNIKRLTYNEAQDLHPAWQP